MLFLPKAPPLFEYLEVRNRKLPDILTKLSATDFTGYAHFIFPSSIAFMVFASGRLGTVLLEEQNGERYTDLNALIILAAQMLTNPSGSISAYKLSNNLGAQIRALLGSKPVYQARELDQLNMRDILKEIKENRISGCLRIFTVDRSAMIFYKDGNPLGFFHDGSDDLVTTATESQKIASLPGAKIDLFSTRERKDLMSIDLLELIDIQKLWDRVVAHFKTQTATGTPQTDSAGGKNN